MRILVVEDFRAIAKGFSEVLREQGHQVDCVIGFRDINTLQAVDIDDCDVTLTAEAYDFALVDGQLEQFNDQPSNPIQGPAVVARLVRSGVPCFGISTEQDFNDKMVSNGAKSAANKAVSFVIFVHSLITVEQAIANDAQTVQRLQECRANITTDAYKAMRRNCDKLVQKYL